MSGNEGDVIESGNRRNLMEKKDFTHQAIIHGCIDILRNIVYNLRKKKPADCEMTGEGVDEEL